MGKLKHLEPDLPAQLGADPAFIPGDKCNLWHVGVAVWVCHPRATNLGITEQTPSALRRCWAEVFYLRFITWSFLPEVFYLFFLPVLWHITSGCCCKVGKWCCQPSSGEVGGVCSHELSELIKQQHLGAETTKPQTPLPINVLSYPPLPGSSSEWENRGQNSIFPLSHDHPAAQREAKHNRHNSGSAL